MKKLVAIFAAVCLAVGLMPTGGALAATVGREMIRDEFAGELKTNNWRMQESENEAEQKVKLEAENNLLAVSSAAPWAYAYYDVPVTVADTEDLVVEWDLVDVAGTGGTYAMYGIVKGLQKDGDVMGFDKKAVAESVGSWLNMEPRGQSAFAMNAYADLRLEEADMPASGTSYRETSSWGYNFLKTDGSNTAQGFTPDFAAKSRRYRQVFKSDGTMEGYTATINPEDGTVGEFALTLLTKSDCVEYRSGYVGIYLKGDTRETILIDNFKAGVRASGSDTVTYAIDDDFTTADANWKDYPGTWGAELGLYSYNSAVAYLLFDNSAEDNYVASAPRTSIEYQPNHDRYVDLSFDVELRTLEAGRAFGVMFGLDKTSDGSGVAGLPYFHFAKEEDKTYLCYSVTTETGYETKEKAEITQVDMTLPFRMRICGMIGGKAEITVGAQNPVVFGAETAVRLEKRFAFLCKGDPTAASAVATVDNVEMHAKYRVVSEDAKSASINFEGKDEEGEPWYNPEDWRFNSVSTGLPNGTGFQGLKIENGALQFVNAGHNSLFATERQYANFEFQFDVTDMQRTVETDDEGKVTKPVMNSPILIALGMPKGGYYLQSNYIEIGSPLNKTINDADFDKATANLDLNSAIGGSTMKATKNTGLRHNLIDPALDGKTVRIRVTVVDGIVKMYYCVLGEEDLTQMLYETSVFEAVMEYPLGQVGISVTGGSYSIGGNMTVDNVYIRDLDTDGTIPTEDKPAEVAPPADEGEGDAEPAPTEPEDKGCGGCGTVGGSGHIGPFALFGLIVVGAAAALCAAGRKRKLSR